MAARGGRNIIPSIHRSDFPKDFKFGTASSCYQFEGGVKHRSENIWDTFTHQRPEKIKDKSNGDIADLSYHLYEEDVRLMEQMGVDAYRFSVSWSRILPSGSLSGGVSKEGIKYYNDLINLLCSKKIIPVVTLFHWDTPNALEDKYMGFLGSQIVGNFCEFADVCFKNFGDRVKYWITLNEPWAYSNGGYAAGSLAPGRGDTSSRTLRNGIVPLIPHRGFISPNHHQVVQGGPSKGDPGTEPYQVTHNQLRAHAAAVQLYRKNYQATQKGSIGITLVSIWALPYTESKEDREAAQRQLDFMFGWFMDPLTTGQYPASMQRLVGNRLPRFTPAESKMLIGSFDFLGLNHYTTYYAINDPNCSGASPSFLTDAQVKLTAFNPDRVPIGPQAGSEWLYVYPKGIWDLLIYVKKKYNNPLIHITENGVSEKNDRNKTIEEACRDEDRINYHANYLDYVKRAIQNGVNVKEYFAWSLLDNFEWSAGYTERFGLHYVDYTDPKLKRYAKDSAKWFKNFLAN